MNRRVVITGVGTVSPLGLDAISTWYGMKEGISGIKALTQVNPNDFSMTFAGEVKNFSPNSYFANAKTARRADRYSQFAMAAAKMAVLVLLNKGSSRLSPFTLPMFLPNISSGMISMEYNFRGPNMSIATACATASHSIGEAWRMIKFGDADAFVCGGTEAPITPMGIAGFNNMKALSTRNDAPERASRPFDRDRDGFVIGEGAGIVVLEEYESAVNRGANILAELAGYGLSSDAYHVTAPSPDGEGPTLAMQMAMEHAKVTPEQVTYINAHGTSTTQGDISETQALKMAFGQHAKSKLLISSTKSTTGHTLGAAGGIELIACIMAMKEGVVPPTINLENQDSLCDLDYIPNEARDVDVKVAMSNSFGFGGHNASLIIKKI